MKRTAIATTALLCMTVLAGCSSGEAEGWRSPCSTRTPTTAEVRGKASLSTNGQPFYVSPWISQTGFLNVPKSWTEAVIEIHPPGVNEPPPRVYSTETIGTGPPPTTPTTTVPPDTADTKYLKVKHGSQAKVQMPPGEYVIEDVGHDGDWLFVVSSCNPGDAVAGTTSQVPASTGSTATAGTR